MSRSRAALLAVCVALAVHASSLFGGFVHDDKQQIAANPLVADLGALPALWQTAVWTGAGGAGSFYRPLMTSSFALDAALFGRAPLPMHAVQLVIWALLVATTLVAVARLAGDVRVGLAAALLLAVHPVDVEAVAWISARCELLAALFGMGALAARAVALDGAAREPSARPGPPGAAAAPWAEGAAVFLALAAKESAVVFLPALLALDRVRGASSTARGLLRRWLPAGLAVAAYAALRARALGGVSGGLVGAADPGVLLGALGQGAVRLLWPVGLTIAPPAPAPWQVVVGALLALAGGAALLRGFVRPASWLVPATLGLAGLAVAAAGAARIGELADRYLLVPVIALGWLLGLAWARLPAPAPLAARVAAGAALGLLALLSFRHVPVYASDARLWRAAAERNPDSERAVQNLAAALVEQGDLAAAEPWLARAAAQAPDDPLVRLNLAVVRAARGDPSGARRTLLGVVETAPGYWPAQLRLGHLALDAGDLAEAARRYQAALAVHGLAAEAWAGLGVVRARQARAAEARAALERALDLDPQLENAAALRSLLASLPEDGR